MPGNLRPRSRVPGCIHPAKMVHFSPAAQHRQIRLMAFLQNLSFSKVDIAVQAVMPNSFANKARVSATTRSWNFGSRASSEPSIGRPLSS